MEWVRAHPYACAIAGAGVLIVAGIVVVKTHASLVSPSGIAAWSGGGGALVDGGSAQAPTTTATEQSPQPISTSSTVSGDGTLPYTVASQSSLQSQTNPSSNQLQALLLELSHPNATPSASGSSNTQISTSISATSAYAFIPTGAMAVSDASQKNYTTAQQELYEYGNQAGTYVKQYEAANLNAPQVLTNSVQSRGDQTKSQAVAQIGVELSQLGKELLGIPDVSAQAQSDNQTLAQNYEAAGTALQQVAASTNGSDTAFVAAMEAYDTKVDALTKSYVAVSLLFSANGVVFGTNDPGSVFTFNESSGL